ncbi:MAG: cobyrinate a,c-diamide synthase [Oscillospiraceae bacterium]|nr:cobyrinate a,c-diamide synthase [Oscillospiraceae bacterium]
MKRIMIAGTNSGCGKTTVTCALLQALVNRGLKVSSFKCGPDYIDPMFHKTVIGTPSYNLDSYIMGSDTIKYLLWKNSGDISVIEGVMGFYDGLSFTEKGSSYELSRITDTSVILVVNCKGMSLSAMAQIKGFKEFKNNKIVGVIFNNLPERLYKDMAEECRGIGIEPFGFLPYIGDARIESRHLGLVTAREISDINKKMSVLADYAEKYIDIDGILQTAECGDTKIKSPDIKKIADVKIAVARDRAFCFYYEDNLTLLRDMGAEIVYFSPLSNDSVPPCDGLILGGGYPELYADILEKNTVSLDSVRDTVKRGAPCIAECGGFMYLHKIMEDNDGRGHKMAGVINGACRKTDSLRRFGYMEMTAQSDNILCKKGEKIRAREFHYFDSDCCGGGFAAEKNGRTWNCVNTERNLFAGFPHIHFWTNIKLAERFIKKCEEYKCTR